VKSAFDAFFTRPMLTQAALLFAQTEHERRLYAATGGSESVIRMLPLPLEELPVRSEGGSFRQRLGIAPEVPLLLFLGRIHKLKGLDMLIAALADILDGRVGPVLAVVGRDDGGWARIEQEFEPLIASRAVRFVGPMYGDERFEAYSDADVFCLTPSHWEETSLAALEAGACGTAVVVTEQADIPDLEAAGGGHVVPFEQGRIRTAVVDAVARSQQMGDNARRHVLRQHDPEAIVDDLERHLRSVACGVPGRLLT
jgi:glycosyltransferase involved in cell wall biosynthesis